MNMKKLKMLMEISILKTFYINFKTQKFKDAIKFPILIGKHTHLDIRGGVKIPLRISSGMIRIGIGGSRDLLHYESRQNYISVRQGATLVFEGCAHFAPHTSILVGANAELRFGDNFSSNNGCRFSVIDKIGFGKDVLFGGNCVVRDSDGHTVYDLEGIHTVAHKNKSPVKIGNHVWIANNCHILKGVTIADDTVIGYGSLVVRDMQECNSIYAGIPAKLMKRGIKWER